MLKELLSACPATTLLTVVHSDKSNIVDQGYRVGEFKSEQSGRVITTSPLEVFCGFNEAFVSLESL